MEITASIFKKKDELGDGYLIDKVLDKTGMKVRGLAVASAAAEAGPCCGMACKKLGAAGLSFWPAAEPRQGLVGRNADVPGCA